MSTAVHQGTGHGGSPSIAVPDYWWYQARTRLLEQALGDFVEPGGRVLDVGSADGPSASWFRERATVTTALDVDPRGLANDGVCGSATALPYADAVFDAVAAFDVVEHCEPESLALHEMRRVLRPDGVLVLSVPAYQWAWSDHDVANGHYRRYTRPRIVDAVTAAGFTVDRATYAFAAVFPMFAAERLLRRVRDRGRTAGAADIATVPTVPRPLHHALMGLCRLDERLLASRDLPFGSSVLLAARPSRA
ncbi:methyltransferase domain-containing protein [Nostocoides sp. F2B08]|uniref:class I SAM-dependent methyltransferase n=1 Tax=Nostocoides sp. F2B08 TaxID=2653936 RepID=UPI001262D569|nr:methyltransferase domain-containing protein [Tetrasphaera sp. F2B08]KAB7743265.1 methyltransferase domain-containing protein [Tetrasphaera sp. F2B08]